MTRFVLIGGGPDERRVVLFQAALAGLGLTPAFVVPYADLLNGHICLNDIVRAGDVVRLESPGKSTAARRALLQAGANLVGYGAPCFTVNPAAPDWEPTRLDPSWQWYRGLTHLMRLVEAQLPPTVAMMNPPAGILTMFDKAQTAERLTAASIPTPPLLAAELQGYDELLALMEAHATPRVFVKLRYGSSGSGIVAYRTDGTHHAATTTVALERVQGELRFYNTRRLRQLTDPREIATLINGLAPYNLIVQRWIPKAGIEGHTCDVRLLMIQGQPAHRLLRLSRSPITNLHLLNQRGDVALLQSRMTPSAWAALEASARRAASLFADSLYIGLDLIITPDLRRHFVLELNAFGDLLPTLLWQGHDSYKAEIRAVLQAGVKP